MNAHQVIKVPLTAFIIITIVYASVRLMQFIEKELRNNDCTHIFVRLTKKCLNSSVFKRLDAFLPQMANANEQLFSALADGSLTKEDIAVEADSEDEDAVEVGVDILDINMKPTAIEDKDLLQEIISSKRETDIRTEEEDKDTKTDSESKDREHEEVVDPGKDRKRQKVLIQEL